MCCGAAATKLRQGSAAPFKSAIFDVMEPKTLP
jgi:hypothetical protein